jgi:hypothetical protein
MLQDMSGEGEGEAAGLESDEVSAPELCSHDAMHSSVVEG